MNQKKLCGVKLCQKEAKFAPFIRVWPDGESDLRECKSICIQLELALCTEHAQVMGQDNILSDEEWVKVCEGLVEMGKDLPSRRTARIEIEKLTPERSVFLNDYPPEAN